ncbi:MAG: hypothetical protein Q8M03_12170, partial [Legionella sp.]|nr:hypothetical protein [Legionella sp.]
RHGAELTMKDIIREEARLIMLRELAAQGNYSGNESLLQTTLESYGISKARDWVREELRRLEDLGAIRITMAGSIIVATATMKGIEHVERRLVIEGVKRPSPLE